METDKETEVKIVKVNKKSKKKVFSIILIAFLILVVIIILSNRKPTSDNLISENILQSEDNHQSLPQYQAKIDDQANVTIEVTPQTMGIEMKENIFELSLNTHSVDLTYDFQKIITLKDDIGNVYEADAWTGSSGGHHLGGNIVFPKINKDAKSVELEINGVGGVKRIFRWDI